LSTRFIIYRVILVLLAMKYIKKQNNLMKEQNNINKTAPPYIMEAKHNIK